MVRQARAQSPTGYYHLMMRGNNRENIFLKDNLKKYFLTCLTEQLEEGLIDLSAYCIMDNHAHIVAKSEPLLNLSAAAKKINTRYAMYYNSLHNRTGHVFQSRYRSETIHDDSYLLSVIRYVHNNPVKAGIVKEAGGYRWSSYNDYIKLNRVISSYQKQFILGLYNDMPQFIGFHRETDTREHLDMDEDIRLFRLQTAQTIISNYLEDNKISNIEELKKDLKCLREIVMILLSETNLRHRQIAQLIDISNARVHTISLKSG